MQVWISRLGQSDGRGLCIKDPARKDLAREALYMLRIWVERCKYQYSWNWNKCRSRNDFFPSKSKVLREIIETKRSNMALMILTSLFLLTMLYAAYHMISDPLRAFPGPFPCKAYPSMANRRLIAWPRAPCQRQAAR